MQIEEHELKQEVRLTFCPLCGLDAEELTIGEVLKYIGESGEMLGYGHPGGVLAFSLIDNEVKYKTQTLDPAERAPAGHPCSDCAANIAHQRAEFQVEVERGGVHWNCTSCEQWGVVMHDDSRGFSVGVRRSAGIEPPNHIGVKFINCKQHESEDDPTGKIH